MPCRDHKPPGIGKMPGGSFFTIVFRKYIICLLDDGQRALVRYGVNTPNYPKFENMFYAAKYNGEYFFFTESDDLPSFSGIAAINPVSKAPSSSALKPSLKMRTSFR